jgi:hypothetical protein
MFNESKQRPLYLVDEYQPPEWLLLAGIQTASYKVMTYPKIRQHNLHNLLVLNPITCYQTNSKQK